MQHPKLKQFKMTIGAAAFFVALITVLVYLPALNNNFVNWDDDLYVYNNRNIISINFTFIKWMFLTFHAYNWHPITWFSHALDYAAWGLNPMGHHLTSILLHAINTFLVVVLMVRLVNCNDQRSAVKNENKGLPYENSMIASIATGLLFGLHPIHVESVAWISERKNVLYAFFFLSSILCYLKYVSAEGHHPPMSTISKGRIKDVWRYRNYALCLLFFILSSMSKPMAVTLPVTLIILDIYPLERLNRESQLKSIRKIFMEKIPFFVLSILLVVLTTSAQQLLMKSIEEPIGKRLLVGINSLCFYLIKIIFPLNFAPIYPYPHAISIQMPAYFGSLIVIIGITTFCILLWRTNKIYAAIWLYYIVTLLPVLGIIQVGNQAAADRYMYLSSLGPFILAGLLATWAWKKSSINKGIVISIRGLLIIFTILIMSVLSVLTTKQITIWENTITLWTYELEKFPNFYDVYVSRGVIYLKLGEYRWAKEDFNRAIKLNSRVSSVYNYRGVVYEKLHNYHQALNDFDAAIDLNPKELLAYFNRGEVNMKIGNYKKAIQDFDKAIELNYLSIQCMQPMGLSPDSNYALAYLNRGVAYSKLSNYEQAIEDYNRALELNPQLGQAYQHRSEAYQQAIKNYDKDINHNPKKAALYVNRGAVFAMMGSYQKALEDYAIAIKLNPKISTVYFNRGLIFSALGEYSRAINEFEAVIRISPQDAWAYYHQGSAYEKIGEYDKAVKNFQNAAIIGNKQAQDYLKSKGLRW